MDRRLDKMQKVVLTVRGEKSTGIGNFDSGVNRARLLDLLQLHFGHSSFRGRQLEAIETALSGKDCFCIMPTGAGKSICYEIPALAKAGVVLVISPLIDYLVDRAFKAVAFVCDGLLRSFALMENQVSGLKAHKIAAEFLSSTQTAKLKNEIYGELESGRPALRLLYVTPELIATTVFLSRLQKLHGRGLLSLIAIDEAHCISSWGHDFRPSYRKLSALRIHFPDIPIMALTATASKTVQEDVIKLLSLQNPRILISSFNRPNISYEVRYKDLLRNAYEDLRKLLNATPGECCIVYCHSRATCDEIGARLLQDRISSRVYHAGLADKKRSQALEDWASGKIPVVVATVAFGMGIDRKDVRTVCHFNVPKSLDSFYQESGRAGRDGMPARSVLYYGMEDRQLMQFLATKPGPTHKHQDREDVKKAIEKNMEAFSKMVEYCEEARCRRQTVLAHFGERVSTDLCAKTCDVCKSRSRVLGNLEDLSLLLSGQREAQSSSYVIRSNARPGEEDPSTFWDDERESEDDISNSDDEEDESTVEAKAAVSKGFCSALSQVDWKIDALVDAEEAFGAKHGSHLQKDGTRDKKAITQAFRDTALKRLEVAVMQMSQRLKIKSVAAARASIILERECFQKFGKSGKSFYNSQLASTVRWLSTCSVSSLESRVGSGTGLTIGVKPSSQIIDVLPLCHSPDQTTPDCGVRPSFSYVGAANEVEAADVLRNAKLLVSKTVVKEENDSIPSLPTLGGFRRGQPLSKFPLGRGPSAPFKKPRLLKDS